MEKLHEWAASWLAPDPDQQGDTSGGGIEGVHAWAATWLAPDSNEPSSAYVLSRSPCCSPAQEPGAQLR